MIDPFQGIPKHPKFIGEEEKKLENTYQIAKEIYQNGRKEAAPILKALGGRVALLKKNLPQEAAHYAESLEKAIEIASKNILND